MLSIISSPTRHARRSKDSFGLIQKVTDSVLQARHLSAHGFFGRHEARLHIGQMSEKHTILLVLVLHLLKDLPVLFLPRVVAPDDVEDL